MKRLILALLLAATVVTANEFVCKEAILTKESGNTTLLKTKTGFIVDDSSILMGFGDNRYTYKYVKSTTHEKGFTIDLYTSPDKATVVGIFDNGKRGVKLLRQNAEVNFTGCEEYTK